jgi:hypothetical protein
MDDSIQSKFTYSEEEEYVMNELGLIKTHHM